jgi:hypothetical protein
VIALSFEHFIAEITFPFSKVVSNAGAATRVLSKLFFPSEESTLPFEQEVKIKNKKRFTPRKINFIYRKDLPRSYKLLRGG